MKVDRERVEYCFEQATQAGRFSQEYCVDRLLELIASEREDEAKWWAGGMHAAEWAGGGCAGCVRMAELAEAAGTTTATK